MAGNRPGPRVVSFCRGPSCPVVIKHPSEPITPQLLKIYQPQPTCPLYTLIPPEIRIRIFEYAVTATDVPDQPHDKSCFYYRPGYTHRQRVDTALLLTCRLVYLESHLLPFSQNEFSFYFYRGPDYLFRAPVHFFPGLNKEQQDAVSHVHIFAQQYWLEGSWEYSAWRSVTLVPQMRPKKVTITIRHTDWWNWEDDEPLGIDPRLPYRVRNNQMLSEDPDDSSADPEHNPRAFLERAWGNQFRNIQSLREVVIELETVERRKAELNQIVKRAKGWRFPLADGRILIRNEEKTRSYTWRASRKFDALAAPASRRVRVTTGGGTNFQWNNPAPPPPAGPSGHGNAAGNAPLTNGPAPIPVASARVGEEIFVSYQEPNELELSMYVVVMYWSAWTVEPDNRSMGGDSAR